ncbi:efflux transporter, RND family, MFP subunit [Acididesulfobacillus acetoxydans]|uniref:Efflux transporter, RND family, MFP subunit n=3 Tax=Acididesulfobacillus acetoxydans TaxID=1561005 RepID=A0A8S0WDV8_9FIRM|nr:efflux RND transporter periplasmic adaptor subunit [Acididesulfobacillus acetoxydans]CAA7599602.1 efflux transporter, RND family, MFP subunit [Acididesulfobacillus acetoxydans]
MKARWTAGLAVGALFLGLVSGCGAAGTAGALPEKVSVEAAQQVAMPVGDTFLGVVTPFVQTSVAPAISGILQTVNVRPGDKITAGQVLATLNTDQLQAQANQAATGVQVAQAQRAAAGEQTGLTVQNAQAALKTAQAGLNSAQTQGKNQVGAAQKALAAAEANLSKAQTGTQNGVTQAQDGLAQAQDGVNQAQSAVAAAQARLTAAQSLTASDLQIAQENVTKAQDAMNTAQTALQHAQQAAHSSTDPGLLAAQAAYDQAAIGYQGALGALQAAQADKSVSVAQAAYNQAQSALQAAQSQVQTAQSALAAAQSGKDVQVAQAAVNQAQQALSAAEAGAASAVKSAEAQVGQAQTAYQTALNNPALQVNDAQIQAAQASLQTIQTNIDKGQIKSPIGGYVQAVNAQVGQAVGPQGGFIVISSMNPLQATVDVPEAQISQVKVGAEMDIYVAATGKTYPGTVSAIHPALDTGNAVLDNGNSNYPVDVLIKQPAAGLLSGMRVEAHEVNPAQKVVLVPANSVLNIRNDQGEVFVVQNGTARSVTVKLGQLTNLESAGGADYPVMSGLKDGDQVVIQGQNHLLNGDKVVITTPVAASHG